MKSDSRDEALRRTLDDAVGSIEPGPGRRIAEVRRRGSGRRAVRWTASVALVSLFVGTFAWLGFTTRKGEVSLDVTTWETYTDPNFGWSFKHPPSWPVQASVAGPEFEGFWSGMTSNIAFEAVHQPNSTGWDMRVLPPDGVVVEVARHGYLTPSLDGYPDTRFPLSLDDAELVGPEVPQQPETRSMHLKVDGDPTFTVRAWFGDRAGSRNRRVAGLVVESIRFPGVPVWNHHETTAPQGSFDAPDTWTVEHRQESDSCWGRSIYLISNIPADIHHSPRETESSCTTEWNYDELPAGLAFVEFATPFESPPPPDGPPLPLTFDEMDPVDEGRFEGRALLATYGGRRVVIRVHWGPDAMNADRDLAEQIVGSIVLPLPTSWIHHADDAHGWTFQHPDDWWVRTFARATRSECGVGEVVTNRPVDLIRLRGGESGCAGAWRFGNLPADLVFVEVATGLEGSAPPPLDGSSVQADSLADRSIDEGFTGQSRMFTISGTSYLVSIWRGPGAYAGDVALAERVVATIRFDGTGEPGSNEAALQAARGFGWTVDELPAGWQATFGLVSCRTSSTALFLASQPFEFARQDRDPSDCSDPWNLDTLPADIVVLRIQHVVGGPTPVADPTQPDTEFPISLEDAALLTQPVRDFDGEIYLIPLWKDGFQLEAVVAHVGADAPNEDVAVMEDLLTSIRVGHPDEEPGRVRFEKFGLGISHPPDWTAWAEGIDCKTSSRWLVAANTDADTHRYVVDDERCSFDRLPSLPSDLVMIEVVHLISSAAGLDNVPSEPLGLEHAILDDPEGFPGRVLVYNVAVGDGATYFLRVHIGDDAPASARSTVNRILDSLTIEPWA